MSTITNIKNVLWNPDGAGTDIAYGILNKKVCSSQDFFGPFIKAVLSYSKEFKEKEGVDIKEILKNALNNP